MNADRRSGCRADCERVTDAGGTRSELRGWIQTRLQLAPALEKELLERVERTVDHHERLWQESKEHALQAIVAGFSRRLEQMRHELALRDAVTHKVTDYFEHVIAELTDQLKRDAKTQLLTFRWFMQRVEATLAADLRGPWCAVGMIDIASFKLLNDTFGHATGDRVIERMADLLRRDVRESDLVTHDEAEHTRFASQLHARFGGDEFCFFLPRLAKASVAFTVSHRLLRAVAEHDWSLEDPRLGQGAVSVDIGVLALRRDAQRTPRPLAAEMARQLLAGADAQLYIAKRSDDAHLSVGLVEMLHGELHPVAGGQRPEGIRLAGSRTAEADQEDGSRSDEWFRDIPGVRRGRREH